MAFSKIILNGVTQIDLTQDTTQADKTIQGYTGHQNDGTGFTGSYVPPTGDDVPTYTYDANNETFVCNKTYEEIYTGNYTYAIFDDDGYEIVCDKSITGVSYILWTYNLSFDLRHNSDESITIIEPSRYALTLNVSDNGTYTPSSGYAYTQVNVNIESKLQEKTITPTTQTQVVTADTDTTLVDTLTCTISASSTSQSFSYDWGNLAIGETYHVVGGGTVSGNGTSGTVTIDTEIVLGQGDNTIPYVGATRVLGTITVKKTGIAPGVTITFDGTNNSGSIELAFYGTYDGLNQVTVNPIPSEYIIPTGTKSITSNGTGVDVAAYATVDVNVPSSGSGGMVIQDAVDTDGGIIRTITGVEISGTKTITENGTYDVSQYASVNVSVSGGSGGVTQDQDGYIVLDDDSGGVEAPTYWRHISVTDTGWEYSVENNHVKFTRTAFNAGKSAPLTGAKNSSSNLNMPKIFTINSGDTVRVLFYNVVNTDGIEWNANAKQADSTTSLSYGFGDSTHTSGVDVTFTAPTTKDIGCWFAYFANNVLGTIEFDFKIFVNGEWVC